MMDCLYQTEVKAASNPFVAVRLSAVGYFFPIFCFQYGYGAVVGDTASNLQVIVKSLFA